MDYRKIRILIADLNESEKDAMLVESITKQCDSLVRYNVLKLEQDSTRKAEEDLRKAREDFHKNSRYVGTGRELIKNLYLGKYKHGSTSKKHGAANRGCECEECIRVLEIEGVHMSEFLSKMSQLTNEYAAALKMEWTKELLASTFALGDGTVVTWGQATISQHEQRSAMLTTMAMGTLGTSAKHIAAINTLKQLGVNNLDEMLAVGFEKQA